MLHVGRRVDVMLGRESTKKCCDLELYCVTLHSSESRDMFLPRVE